MDKTQKNFETLEVGRTYKDKVGKEVLISGYIGKHPYVFIADGITYTHTGAWNRRYANEFPSHDLVELISLPSKPETQETIKPTKRNDHHKAEDRPLYRLHRWRSQALSSQKVQGTLLAI